MTSELASRYTPADIEPRMTEKWLAAKAFHADPADPGDPYCIVIPPPNVTAALHLGHALNNALQDVLIRHHRMRGFNTLWMPGTDHAGIATQTVVEKRVLAEEGKRRTDFAREAFVTRIQAWKDEYEQVILGQLKAMGCSCDWDRTRFTMDEMCAKAVREAFFRLFRDGLIYRGKRLVNWDPVTQTALADDEVENEEIDGHFYYLKYPLAEPASAGGQTITHVTVATTRPETMLGDTAVAVNPRDPRAAALCGKKVRLPIVGRILPIIEDDYVVLPDPEGDEKARFSSGFLKVTPAHDPNDWDLGVKHKLPVINVMAPDASISKEHGWSDWDATARDPFCAQLLGMDRFEARAAIVEWFRQEQLLEEVRPYRHSVGHSYRSHVPIEPYLSDQWYVKVTDDRLRGAALRALTSRGREPADNDTAGPTSRGREPAGNDTAGETSEIPRAHARASSQWCAYLLTFTTYGTWLHGDERGSVDREHNLPGSPVMHGGPERERREAGSLKHAPTQLSDTARQVVQQTFLDVAEHRGWHVAAIHVRPTHCHVVIAADAPPERVMGDLKSYASRRLREQNILPQDQPVWTRHGSTRYLNDEDAIARSIAYVVEGQGQVMSPAPYRAASLFTSRGRESADNDTAGEIPRAHASGSSDSRAGAAPSHTGLRFVPERYANTYRQWNENIRDWCISRQLWWGHRIPVWTKRRKFADAIQDDPLLQLVNIPDDATGPTSWSGQILKAEYRVFVSDSARKYADSSGAWWLELNVCVAPGHDDFERRLEAAGLKQDPDVLDTWFSSALWPISTMGWPEQTAELARWNPGSVLCTAREIITLWVSRMVMFNLYFRDCLPFTDVFIHAMIQDGEGRKMSKSLGNGVDPLNIIQSHGADAMRFTLVSMTTQTQDVRMPVERDAATGRNTSPKFDYGRNFANKLWNAVRFALSNLSAAEAPSAAAGPDAATLPDRWILSRLAETVRQVDAALARYEFSVYAQTLYDFIWRDFCDWYIEAVKPTVKSNAHQQRVLSGCIDVILRLLHPVMPFITEKLWERLNEVVPQRSLPGADLPGGALLARAAWPVLPLERDGQAESHFALVQRVVTKLREVRTTYKVPPRQRVNCSAKMPAEPAQILFQQRQLVETLANIQGGEIGPQVAQPADAAVAIDGELELYLHGLIDADAERNRIARRMDELDKSITTLEGRLSNSGYINRAPVNLVQQTRDQLASAKKEREALTAQLAAL